MNFPEGNRLVKARVALSLGRLKVGEIPATLRGALKFGGRDRWLRSKTRLRTGLLSLIPPGSKRNSPGINHTQAILAHEKIVSRENCFPCRGILVLSRALFLDWPRASEAVEP
jgi:hypothetical protein